MDTTETAELNRWREAGKEIGRKLGRVEERERILAMLEAHQQKALVSNIVYLGFERAIRLIKEEKK
jgi:hypothetical protein